MSKDFPQRAGDIFAQFVARLGQVDLSQSQGIPGALSNYLAAAGINGQLIEQVGLVSYERRNQQTQGPDVLSRGFQNMKSFLSSAGRSRREGGQVASVDLESSLDRAKEILASEKRRFVEPDLAHGHYSGLVLGETAGHVLLSVDGRAQTATAIEKSLLSGLKFSLNKVFNVQFRDGKAIGQDRAQSLSQSQTARRLPGR